MQETTSVDIQLHLEKPVGELVSTRKLPSETSPKDQPLASHVQSGLLGLSACCFRF